MWMMFTVASMTYSLFLEEVQFYWWILSLLLRFSCVSCLKTPLNVIQMTIKRTNARKKRKTIDRIQAHPEKSSSWTLFKTMFSASNQGDCCLVTRHLDSRTSAVDPRVSRCTPWHPCHLPTLRCKLVFSSDVLHPGLQQRGDRAATWIIPLGGNSPWLPTRLQLYGRREGPGSCYVDIAMVN